MSAAIQRSTRGYQHISRSGVGQSSSYDQGNSLAPRLVNKSGAVYTVTNSHMMIDANAEVDTDMIGHLSENGPVEADE